MTYTVPSCYNADGTPVVVADKSVVIYPAVREGRAQPSPATAAANVVKAIAALSPQAGLK